MPGPSFAPAFAATGTFLLLIGLVFGGITLVLGAIALSLTLLYWLAEGLRVYDHDIGPTATSLPAVVDQRPPPGVHMPGPSWRPFVGAFGVFLLFLGLVFGGWLLAVGVIALISTLVGWLTDAVGEYRKTVEADSTGHLENIPTSPVPKMLIGTLLVLTVGAAILQSSVFATGQANGGTGTPGASGAPAPSGGAASGAPPPASGPAADVHVQAKDVAYVQTTLDGTGRQAVHDRVRQRGPGNAAQHRTGRRIGHRGLQGRHLPRRRDAACTRCPRNRPATTSSAAPSTRP